MFVGHSKDIPGYYLESSGSVGILKKSLLGPEQGWEDYVMRLFDVEKGGCSPHHSHPWPHIVFIVKGKGRLTLEGKEHEVEGGTYAFIPSNAQHQFVNTGTDILQFICIVPPEGN